MPVINKKERKNIAGNYVLPDNAPYGYIDLTLERPAEGKTPEGDEFSYTHNDCSIGYVDGDGE